MKRLLSLSILIIGLLTACGPDKDIFIPDPIFSQGIITSSISGYVIDENNQSVEGASVNLNQFSRTTDANGYFNFQNVQVDAERTSLTVSMQGYFEGGRAILPIEDGITQLKIKLLEKTVINSFEGSNGGTVDLQQGTVLEIPADAALDQNNVGFSGEVQVASHNLNPQNLDGLSKMPTDLKANDASNQELLLESFGIFLFEWIDASDQKLSIVPGKKATLTFPVPPSMIANAPANIGLWFFDGANWIEEGSATLVNGSYVAELSKTGFWNFAQPHEYVSVKGVLKNENNQSLSHMPFSVSIDNGGVLGFSFNDNDGTFVANVPKNLASQITILDECNDMDYIANIGALNEDALVSNVKISNSLDFSRFNATLLNCDNSNVQNGYVILSVDTKTYFFPIANGKLKGDINACDFPTATLVAYDVENQQQSEPLPIDVLTTVDAGEIIVCF